MNDLDADHPLAPELAELIAGRFAALADPMRIRLLDALRRRGEASVQELASELEAGTANVSKHLRLLRERNMVGRRQQGTRVLYRIVDDQVLELCERICGAVEDQLRELSALVAARGARAATRSATSTQQETE